MKLIINNTRNKLFEGRTKGISFAFCNKIEDGFEEVMPLSPCKDYLNDAWWAETFNKESNYIYGFSHKPVGLFKKDNIYLSTADLPRNKSEPYVKYNLDNGLVGSIENIEKILAVKRSGSGKQYQNYLNINTISMKNILFPLSEIILSIKRNFTESFL